jgi:SAM-dependent methyltransferase
MADWNELFKREEFRWRDPHASVVALAPLLQERGARRILDLACGSGRHLVYLARLGFQSYGVDNSENGLEYARQWLAREGLAVELAPSDMSEIPYADEFFDAAICIHAIQHQRLAGLGKTLGEVRRVLRAGGLFFATFPGRRDRRYGEGKELERNTFIAELGPDAGVPHHYSNLAEVESLLQGFVICKIELEEHVDEKQDRYSHWNVLAERE